MKKLASENNNLYYCDVVNSIGSTNFTTVDGLHYDTETYKKIYQAMKKCN